MPSFVWKGTTRAGQTQEGSLAGRLRATPRSRCCGGSRSRSPASGRRGKEIKLIPRFARRRPAASASPSSPASSRSCSTPACRSCSAWRSSATRRRTSTFQRDHQPGAQDVESGSSLADAHAQAPQGVRQPVHQHGGGRRGGRYPRHHPAAPLDLHREGGQAEQPGQVGADLPGRRSSSSPPWWCSSSSGR